MNQHEVLSSAVVAWATAKLLEWGKKQSWFPMGYDTERLNRVVAITVSALVALGLHVAYDPTLDGGTLTITGLSMTSIWNGAFYWLRQYMLTDIAYKQFVRPKEQP